MLNSRFGPRNERLAGATTPLVPSRHFLRWRERSVLPFFPLTVLLAALLFIPSPMKAQGVSTDSPHGEGRDSSSPAFEQRDDSSTSPSLDPSPDRSPDPSLALNPDLELAWVNDVPIRVVDVRQQVRRVIGNRTVDPARVAELAEETLQVLIDRQLVLLFLERQGRAATEEDVTLALRNWEQRLAAVSEDPQEVYERHQTSSKRMRAALYWSISWQRMLETYLTDVNLERFFEQHQADHDGRRLRVAHIFWKVDDSNLAEKQAEADRIRSEIESDKLSFADAAEQHSQAPSAEEGGELGWIERHDPMPESFSRVAFQLKEGEVSHPVLTTLGLHLIQCLEIEPGTRQWTDIRPELERALSRYLFRWAASKERPEAVIRLGDAEDWAARLVP